MLAEERNSSRALIERQGLKEGFRRQPAPAAEQMVQIGCGYSGRICNHIDLRLRLPVSANVSDGAAHDIVVGRRGREWGEFGEAFGQR